MKNTYRMLDEGLPFKVIRLRRKLVGRVCRHADGGFLGVIGRETVRAETEVEAFREVAARMLGFADYATLRDRNATILRRNAGRKAAARAAVDRILDGDFSAFEKLVDASTATDVVKEGRAAIFGRKR